MRNYTPTVEDLAWLAENRSEKFSSATQTLRSLGHAVAHGDDTPAREVQKLTVDAQYGDYLDNGGEALTESPIPAEPTEDAVRHDPVFGVACVECGSGTPCCLKTLTLSCKHDHNAPRKLTIPADDPKKPAVLAVVADHKDTGGYLYEQINASLGHESKAECRSTGLKLRLTGPGVEEIGPAEAFECKLPFHIADDEEDRSNLEKLGLVMDTFVWDDPQKSATIYDLSPADVCVPFNGFNSKIHLYPPMSVQAENLGLTLSGRYNTNNDFKFTAAFSGSLAAEYGSRKYEIGAKVETDSHDKNRSKSAVPFLDGILKALSSISSGETKGRSGGKANSGEVIETYSYIEVSHVQHLKNWTYTLAENPGDYSRVGIEGNITLGFDPFLKVKLYLDVLDALLIAANGAAPALAQAIRQARELGAKGFRNKDKTLEFTAGAAVFIKGEGDLGTGTITLSRKPDQDDWEATGHCGGSVALTLGVEIKGRTKVYFIEGTLDVNGKATSNLSLDLQTVPKSQRVGNEKLQQTLSWGGVKLKYKAEINWQLGYARGGVPNPDHGTLSVFKGGDLYVGQI